MKEDEANRARPRGLTLGRGLVVIAIIVIAIIAAFQVLTFVPRDPITFGPQTGVVSNTWIAATYGTGAVTVTGVHSDYGNTLLLNNINSQNASSATWSIPFSSALDIKKYITTFDLYVPSSLFFASTASPLTISVGGQLITYTPYNSTTYSWHNGPVYIPNASELHYAPVEYSRTLGPYAFLVFPFSSRSIATGVHVNITIPSRAQIYIPDLAVVATGHFNSYVQNVAVPTGGALLVALAGCTAILFYVLRRLWIQALGLYVVVGTGIRLALSPLFLQPDLLTLSRYNELIYNYHLVNLQSFVYGLAWLTQMVLPASMLYTAGINPTNVVATVLIKLPGIAFDILTFLLLVRLLQTRMSAGAARTWALVGWLFNPLVIYFSAMHGLYESTVGFFILLIGYGIMTNRTGRSVWGQVLSLMLILSAVVTIPVLLAWEKYRWRHWLAITVIPSLVYVLTFTWFYGTPTSLISYLQSIVGGPETGHLGLSRTALSSMTYLNLLHQASGMTSSALVGFMILLAVLATLLLSERRLSNHEAVVALAGSLTVFYFAYPSFFIQHFIWLFPLLIAMVALSGVKIERGLAFVLGISALGVTINYLAYWWPRVDPYLATVFFALLPLPILWYWEPRFSKNFNAFPLMKAWGICAIASGFCLLGIGAYSGTATFTELDLLILVASVALLNLRITMIPLSLRMAGKVTTAAISLCFSALSFLPFYLLVHSGDLLEVTFASVLLLCGLFEFATRVYRGVTYSRRTVHMPADS